VERQAQFLGLSSSGWLAWFLPGQLASLFEDGRNNQSSQWELVESTQFWVGRAQKWTVEPALLEKVALDEWLGVSLYTRTKRQQHMLQGPWLGRATFDMRGCCWGRRARTAAVPRLGEASIQARKQMEQKPGGQGRARVSFQCDWNGPVGRKWRTGSVSCLPDTWVSECRMLHSPTLNGVSFRLACCARSAPSSSVPRKVWESLVLDL
jgi:hypothetical protein